MIPDHITKEVDALVTDGFAIDITEESDWINTIFHDYPVPPTYGKSQTELLIRIPISYPNGRPDMFWTDVDLATKDGHTPKSADHIENYLGRQWRRFSWHPQNWNPGVDDLSTYLEFVNTGLTKAAHP